MMHISGLMHINGMVCSHNAGMCGQIPISHETMCFLFFIIKERIRRSLSSIKRKKKKKREKEDEEKEKTIIGTEEEEDRERERKRKKICCINTDKTKRCFALKQPTRQTNDKLTVCW